MKRFWSALALILLMLGALVPCDALCTSAHQSSAHVCCRHTSRTPEIKTCCAPRPAQQSIVPQITQIAPAAVQLHDNESTALAAHIFPHVHSAPIAFPPHAIPIPPLILRI